MSRLAVLACLVFSGLCALVYQIVWTRLLGFAFGTTTEAIGTVLGIFFAGLALGNWIAARRLAAVERPLRVYALLEAFVGVFALLSLPLLRALPESYAWFGVPETGFGLGMLRVAAAALLLLPPTIAMGATLPVVARGFVVRDDSLGRSCAWLYAANTLGAVLGAYGCGFWLIPGLGLTHSVLAAGAVNLIVGATVFAWARDVRVAPAPAESPAPAGAAASPDLFLLLFAVSGFVAIGYEIVWSKVFGIVMEGTLYGFASVLSAVLLGIALGSALIAGRVDRLRDPVRAFALVHVGIGAAVVLGSAAIPYLPWLYDRLAHAAPAGDAVHLLYLLVLPIVLLPMALFGVAFPILIRIYAREASAAARGLGLATAVNTAGSIAASFCVGFWWIPAWGSDATLYALLLLDMAVALVALAQLGASRAGARATLAGALAVSGLVAFAYGGVRIEDAIAGRQLEGRGLGEYVEGLERAASARALTLEGKSSVVTVYVYPEARLLRTNGLPEAGVSLAPPSLNLETVLLGAWPYALAENPRHALVIGLGGANTLSVLLETQVASVEVVELERGVTAAATLLHEGLDDPLGDPRVKLRIDDGRNYLLRRARAGGPGYDLIASQPSHPWRVGAADLFTEEFFATARDALSPGGVFAAWLNGFRMDPDSFLAVVASFERVFPGALLVDAGERGRQSYLLLGARAPLALDAAALAARLSEPRLASLLAGYGVRGPADLVARIEGPARVFAELAPGAANTDDNAYVETRTPHAPRRRLLDFGVIEARLPAAAPLLPELRGRWDAAAILRALQALGREGGPWPYAGKLERFLTQHGDAIDPLARALARLEAALRDPQRADAAERELRALAQREPARPEPWRALGMHLARRRSAWREASDAFARAFAASRAPADAYDAGRALHPADAEAARTWFARIPAAARAEFPRLAYYDAAAALARGLRGDALAEADRALERFLETDAGRSYPGAYELASRVAFARGDAARARRHADLDTRQRTQEARRWLARAESASQDGRDGEARSALQRAAELTPADEQIAWRLAELALKSGAHAELERALEALRATAPSRARAIGAENAFRSQHGLPLLPQRAPRPGSS